MSAPTIELGKKLCAQLVPAVTGQGGEAGAAPTGAPAHLAPLLGVLRGWK